MPNDPIVWTILIILAVVVVLLALWIGDVVEVGLDPPTLKFKGRKREAPPSGIRIGPKAQIERARFGDITGYKGTGAAGGRPTGPVDIVSGAHVTDTVFGDIIGVQDVGVQDTPPEGRKPSAKPHGRP